MRSAVRRLALVALMALVASGCPRVEAPPERPIVELRALALTAVSPVGISGELALDLTNPNSTAVTVAAIDWELRLGRTGALRGRAHPNLRLAARESTSALVGISVDAAAAAQIAPYLPPRQVPYQLRAVVHVHSSRGDLTVVLDERATALVR